MMIDERDIERVLARADIVDVIESCGIQLKKKGVHYECCCPFHNEKTPSFIVDTRKQTWFCYGACQEGGNAIRFLMRLKGLSFPEAVKELAEKYNIDLHIEKKELTTQELQDQAKRDSMIAINKMAAEYYVANLALQNSDSIAARSYIDKRWSRKFATYYGIGFAPDSWDGLAEYARKKGFSIDLMLEMGLLKRGQGGKIYDFYRNRVMIPIRDKFARVIGFTARDLSGKDNVPKYLNSAASVLYDKENTIFGIDIAYIQAAKEELFYMVEGAPDVLRLHLLGVENTVAPLGSAWTKHQLQQLKKYASTLCFIPDIDVPKDGEHYGTGIKSVLKHGAMALSMGFKVQVIDIAKNSLDAKPITKADPDSFITERATWNNLLGHKQDFILWFVARKWNQKATTEERSSVINEVAKFIAIIDDGVLEKMYLKQLSNYSPKDVWTTAIREAKKNVREESKQKGKTLDKELLTKYGFYEENNCYFSVANNGEYQWSNFVMEPMFHIKDAIAPKRLYKIRNVNRQEEIIELKQEDLVSLAKFKQKVEGLGNYIWLAKEEQLTKLKMFLYEQTETALEIVQLGWQKQGFFAYGNGVYANKKWYAVDEYGIVRLDDERNFYLPAFSRIYREEQKLFQFERKFIHLNYSAISLQDFSKKLVAVFGDNAKVGICYLLAALFRDIITSYSKFPLLNLFGPKGSGKTELGTSLMAFFVIENQPPNIQSSTKAALGETVAQCANALVHLDEYRNDLEMEKREFLKSIWDGVGRSRMNMDRDKKRETTAVDCGVIVSGQEMATADIALFSRMVFLTFDTSEFTAEAKREFNDLLEERKKGLSHLTLQILSHREKFEREFAGNYKSAFSDITAKLEQNRIEDRILRNWIVPLAAFRTLSGVLELPFSYNEMLTITLEGIIRQNSECKSNNELGKFWDLVAYLRQNGDVHNEADYRIVYTTKFACNKPSTTNEYNETKRILLLRKSRIFQLYKKEARAVGETSLPEGSLKFYLEKSPEYIGMKNSVRFKNMSKGYFDVVTTKDENGRDVTTYKQTVDMAMAFDYDMLNAHYNINLEVADTTEPDEFDEKKRKTT